MGRSEQWGPRGAGSPQGDAGPFQEKWGGRKPSSSTTEKGNSKPGLLLHLNEKGTRPVRTEEQPLLQSARPAGSEVFLQFRFLCGNGCGSVRENLHGRRAPW